MQFMLTSQLVVGIVLVFGMAVGYFIRQVLASHQASTNEFKIKSQLDAARNETKAIILAAKDKAAMLLDEVKKEEKEMKSQFMRLEDRLSKKEESFERKEQEIEKERGYLADELQKIKNAKGQIDELRQRAMGELERVAHMTETDARAELFKKTEEGHRSELGIMLQRLSKEKKEEIEKKSIEIMTSAIQRYARSHIAETTISTVMLPSDELKGKIIGREGRNIRTLERLTGVEIIVDETPEAITISSFDPMRREITKLALEKLIKDGRIQPAKIEEKVEEAKQEINERIRAAGEEAAYETGILDLPPEIILLLGRLSFRTSYGQNVLLHSVEMTHISGMLAAELKANVEVAKKGALLHDIGKAVDHEVQGTHVEIGRKILKKYGVAEEVIKAMEAHHEDYPFATPESYIVAAADAISAARPGARRDTLENYIKRLEDLEKIAVGFPGVKNAYAISAGREIRIFVEPEKIDDFAALQLAKDIASKIQSELRYPGEIKVNVIREIRAVEYAR
ncbi:MAG: ribonuclease Y [Parcubacteria group bacterium RIFCSPLOWO2_01_FULL_48_18]|nr:MAG: ribonuclease Y [Parcubacteria group bacterium RIFCSPLOWO2_01_FULL_48_18]OHB22798.1 MAG: ribonuclease Y [Parcubacteria group bacterium RIFCSPHIGHO2_02_FULL_48_10b]